jgi:hypothetical protein
VVHHETVLGFNVTNFCETVSPILGGQQIPE